VSGPIDDKRPPEPQPKIFQPAKSVKGQHNELQPLGQQSTRSSDATESLLRELLVLVARIAHDHHEQPLAFAAENLHVRVAARGIAGSCVADTADWLRILGKRLELAIRVSFVRAALGGAGARTFGS